MDDNDYGENTEENDTQILPEGEIVSEEPVQEVSTRKRRHRRNSRKRGSGDGEHVGHRRHELIDGVHGHRKHRHKSRSLHGVNPRTSFEDVGDNHDTNEVVRDWPSDQGDVEDGEILEDGEIPDDVGDKDDEIDNDAQNVEKSTAESNNGVENAGSIQSESSEKEVDGAVDIEKEAEAKSDKEEEGKTLDAQHERRERKRKRKEKKEKKKNKDEKKKKKRHEYVDYDRMDEMEQNWPGAGGNGSLKRSPPGPYDSPYGSSYDSPYKSPPGPYDSPYASPPGPYDSPQYEDEESATRQPQKTLMSMVDDDDYVDANIAANEKEGIFSRKNVPVRGRGGNCNNTNRKPDRQHSFPPMKKKPLLETPMDQRPLCKFFREGKCAKGVDCPFNHNFRPPKKPDICKFYLNGSCSKGDGCVFMHNEFPCKYFHMGANCYQGDNCRFNHDPLTEETRPLFEKLMNENRGDMEEEESSPIRPHKPSLLGSPPRHIKEQAERLKQQQNMKNIPSIFDIQVFPPNASPQRHPPNSSPPAQQSNRPSGFYMDTEMPPGGQASQAKPDASCGSQNGSYGPPDGSFISQDGSFGSHNGSYGQQEGSFGPPNGLYHGPGGGPPHVHQHQGGPPQGPQSCCPPGPRGVLQHRPQGDPQFGASGQGMMRGPRPPGPSVSMPTTMNTAVAMIGALLRHAAPNILRPQLSCPPVGGSPVHQGAVGQFPDMSPQRYVDNQNYQMPTPERDQSSDKKETTNNIQDEAEEQVEVVTSCKNDTEETKVDLHGEDEVLKHLPPKQRELFLRIQHQQQQERKNRIAKQSKQEQDTDPANDNWYSSDEEEGSSKSLSDMLKNISKKSFMSSDAPPSSSALNVMQMINAIRSQAAPENTLSVPTHVDPRIKKTDPRQKARDPRQQASPVGLLPDPWQQPRPVPPPPTIINSKEGDIPVYIIYPLLLDIKQTIPPDVSDAKFKNDPRILKYKEKQKEQSDPRLEGKENTERPKDPRVKQLDPRVPKQKDVTNISEKPLDPRLARVPSEQQPVNKPNDPRLQRVQSGPPMGMHNFPVRPVEPWSIRQPEPLYQGPCPPVNSYLGQGPSHGPFPGAGTMRVGQPENFNLNDGLRPLRQLGPRFGGPPGPGGQMMAMGPGCGPRQRFGARFSMHGPQNDFNFDPQTEGFNRPPFRHGTPQLGRQESAPDPRFNRQDSWATRQDSGGDPRFNRQDSGIDCSFKRQDSVSDPRLSNQDSYRDPRLNRQDSGLDSRKQELSVDPRLSRQDSGNDPRINRQDSHNDPRIRKTDFGDPRVFRKDSLEQRDSEFSTGDSPKTSSSGDALNTQIPTNHEKELSISSVISRQLSNPGTNTEKANVQSDTNPEQVKVKFDHRNDPRFRRKPATESSAQVKRKFIGQRKSSMEYSSPLGLDSDKLDSGSGYNSYNRPQPNSNKSNNSIDSLSRTNKIENSETEPVVSEESAPPMPDQLLQPNLPEPQLKDLFKTFDPTASPFC